MIGDADCKVYERCITVQVAVAKHEFRCNKYETLQYLAPAPWRCYQIRNYLHTVVRYRLCHYLQVYMHVCAFNCTYMRLWIPIYEVVYISTQQPFSLTSVRGAVISLLCICIQPINTLMLSQRNAGSRYLPRRVTLDEFYTHTHTLTHTGRHAYIPDHPATLVWRHTSQPQSQ